MQQATVNKTSKEPITVVVVWTVRRPVPKPIDLPELCRFDLCKGCNDLLLNQAHPLSPRQDPDFSQYFGLREVTT